MSSRSPSSAAVPTVAAGPAAGTDSMAEAPGDPWWPRETRRVSDPARAQQLWDAIVAVRAQKQIPAIVRTARYMNRFHQVNKEETQRLLDAAVEDNLIKLERKVGTKGHKSGVEEKAYRLPTPDMLPRERHDWYCFHCHAGGEVLLCAACHRVFHQSCHKAENPYEDEGDVSREWLCHFCRAGQKISSESNNKKERKDLNHLLRLLCGKLKNKLPHDILQRDPPQQLHKTNSSAVEAKNEGEEDSKAAAAVAAAIEKEGSWRANFLLKAQTTLDEMEKKCIANQFRIIEEFRGDAQLIVHNIVIYHGAHSSLADLGRQMLRDCLSDLKEIRQCRDCYRYSNEQREKYWFCKPCRPYHELVYAKQKGFPYWPAKVVSSGESGDDTLEVRFFGGYHQKATVQKGHVKPISVNIHTLQVKRNSLWNKACEELRKHQELLVKFKNNESFHAEPYGNPFLVCDIKKEIGEGSVRDSDSGQEEEEEEEDQDQKESLEEQIQLQQQQQQLIKQQQLPTKQEKKKRGKAKRTKKEDSEDLVSSSCQELRFVNAAVQTKGSRKAEAEQPRNSNEEFRQLVEKMRADFDQEKKRAVNVATRSLERDLERLKADHATEVEELIENHKQEISENKRKQWCFNCETEAIYWCCWNTAYCSIECQQEHWHKEHKRTCRRKR